MEFSLSKPQAHMWANWSSYQCWPQIITRSTLDYWIAGPWNILITVSSYLCSDIFVLYRIFKITRQGCWEIYNSVYAVNNVYDTISYWYDIVVKFLKTRFGKRHAFVLNSAALFQGLFIWLLILCKENKYLFTNFIWCRVASTLVTKKLTSTQIKRLITVYKQRKKSGKFRSPVDSERSKWRMSPSQEESCRYQKWASHSFFFIVAVDWLLPIKCYRKWFCFDVKTVSKSYSTN